MKRILIFLMSLLLIFCTFVSCVKFNKRIRPSVESYVESESVKHETDETDEKESETKETDTPETEAKDTYQSTDNNTSYTHEHISDYQQPFYGIWCYASTNLSDAQSFVASNPSFEIFVTSEWSNLNTTTYYAVTAGKYYTIKEAEAALPNIRRSFSDAYIKYSGEKLTEYNEQEEREVDLTCGNIGKSFYGVWCQAEKSFEEISRTASNMQSLGYEARIYYTPDWSNLNQEPYYAISIGEHSTLEEANNALTKVKHIYPDAYVKYSGVFK